MDPLAAATTKQPPHLAHRHKYKDTSSQIQSQLKEKCLRKVHANRMALIKSARGSGRNVKEHLHQLIQQVQDEGNEQISINSEEYLDLLLSLEAEVEEVLRQEERAALEEYESNLAFEQEMIESMLDSMSSTITIPYRVNNNNSSSSSSDDSGGMEEGVVEQEVVVCPCCRQNRLLRTHHSLVCKCGIRVPTKNDYITLSMVQKQISDAYQEHSAQCQQQPRFCVDTNNFGGDVSLSFLSLRCDHCGALRIIV